jgi:hypothetical protein
MSLLLYLLPAAAAILTVYCFIAHLRHAAKEKSFGCKPAPTFRRWDILGIKNIMMEMNGLKTHRLSNSFKARKNAMSTKTGRNCKTFFIRYPPADTWVYTFEPKNLQAVLATQFHDFQQASTRVNAFEPLLGLGIVSRATTIEACIADWDSSRPMDQSGNILEHC